MPTSRFVYWNDRSHKKDEIPEPHTVYPMDDRPVGGYLLSISVRLLPSLFASPSSLILALFLSNHTIPLVPFKDLYTLLLPLAHLKMHRHWARALLFVLIFTCFSDVLDIWHEHSKNQVGLFPPYNFFGILHVEPATFSPLLRFHALWIPIDDFFLYLYRSLNESFCPFVCPSSLSLICILFLCKFDFSLFPSFSRLNERYWIKIRHGYFSRLDIYIGICFFFFFGKIDLNDSKLLKKSLSCLYSVSFSNMYVNNSFVHYCTF